MALKKSYTSPFGTSHANAYHVVDMVKISSLAKRAVVGVNIFSTEANRNGDKLPVGTNTFMFDGDDYDNVIAPESNIQSGDNLHKSIYNHLKALDEYEGAEDC